MLKVSSSLTHPPQNDGKWRSFKSFAKLNENHILMDNFSKLRKYQTFVLIELHNLSKDSHEKAVFTITGSPNIHFLKFWAWHFKFSNFQTTFVKIFTKKPLGFKIGFESTDKFYLFTIIYDLKFLDNQTTTLWFFFFFFFFFFIWNLHGRAFYFLKFVRWEKY